MEHLTRKNVKAKVKYITKEYKKDVVYSKKEINKYGVLIYIEIRV